MTSRRVSRNPRGVPVEAYGEKFADAVRDAEQSDGDDLRDAVAAGVFVELLPGMVSDNGEPASHRCAKRAWDAAEDFMRERARRRS